MKKTKPEYYPPVENLLDLIYEHYTENNPVEKNTVAGKAAKAKYCLLYNLTLPTILRV